MKRRHSREAALQLLYGLEFDASRKVPSSTDPDEKSLTRETDDPFVQILVDGVMSELEAIDRLIKTHSIKWKLMRMTAVDRNILRLAVYELRFAAEKTDPAVIINESIEIAKRFSSDKSSAFIHGLLDSIRKGEADERTR